MPTLSSSAATKPVHTARTPRTTTPDSSTSIDIVHVPILLGFDALVHELGGDPRKLPSRVNLKRDLSDPSVEVTFTELLILLDEASQRLNCPDFGLRLAVRQSKTQDFGLLDEVIRNLRTVGETLEYISRHSYAYCPAARLDLRRNSHGDLVASQTMLIKSKVHRGQAIEFMALTGHLRTFRLTRGRLNKRRLLFRHQPISPLAVYRRHFGCDVLFGQSEDGAVYSQDDLDIPIVDPNPIVLAESACSLESRRQPVDAPFELQVREMLIGKLTRGECNAETIAGAFNIHAKTLHRRLRSEKTTFQQVKDEARRDLLAYYLGRTSLNFVKIAEQIGFAEQSVMSRKCRKWFNASPREVRRAASSSPGSNA
jgi:AraC-like DNA-binding protein